MVDVDSVAVHYLSQCIVGYFVSTMGCYNSHYTFRQHHKVVNSLCSNYTVVIPVIVTVQKHGDVKCTFK